MSRPVSDWADLKYRLAGHLAHIVPFGRPASLCGLLDHGDDPLYGTGCFDEIEKARALPTCGLCLASAYPDQRDLPTEDLRF